MLSLLRLWGEICSLFLLASCGDEKALWPLTGDLTLLWTLPPFLYALLVLSLYLCVFLSIFWIFLCLFYKGLITVYRTTWAVQNKPTITVLKKVSFSPFINRNIYRFLVNMSLGWRCGGGMLFLLIT